jgi:hypothetical protein
MQRQRRIVLIFLLSLVTGEGSIHKATAQGGAQPVALQQPAAPAEAQPVAPPGKPQPVGLPADSQQEAAAAPPHILTDICFDTSLFSNWYPRTLTPKKLSAKAWERAFPILVMNLRSPTHDLYWTPREDLPLIPITYQAFSPRIATTDNLIVLICNARQGDGSTINATPVLVNGPDAAVAAAAAANHAGKKLPPGYIDRMFLLDAAKGNDIVKVDFQGQTATKGNVPINFQAAQYQSQLLQDQAAIDRDQANRAADQIAAQAADADAAQAAKAAEEEKDPAKIAAAQANAESAKVKDAAAQAKVAIDNANLKADTAKRDADFTASQTTDRVTDTIATVFVERHKVIHFSAGAGLLFTEGRSTNYSMLTVPTTVTTTTTISSTTVLTNTTTVVGSNSQTTPVTTTGTANFAFGTLLDRPQINGIAGLTYYPFGHDTFPVSQRKGDAITYSTWDWKSLGLFFGTSVSSLGNFTVAPAYEVLPGIQVFAGPSWYSRSYLPSKITACSGYGTSASYAGPMTTATQTLLAPGPPPTTTTTTTTVAVATTNGCANGDTASALSGSTVQTQSHYVTAFAFGFLFNTNLFKAFSGIK